ncbi:MAG: OmpA family protein [Deltaproteobacteria bacterium]|nr:OmpA family protein [Deltaproteobacteria bacterium]
MKKLTILLALLGLGVATPSFAQITATEVQNPTACTGSAGNCGRWYELIEETTPPACDAARQNREECHRWYSEGREAPKPVVQAAKIEINQIVYFDFNKSNIKPESYGVLDDVASVLKNNPKIQRVRIEGHTDSIGSEAYNEKLSDRRAASVKTYLTSKGISADRLESVGYGKTRPIADNGTEAGRAKNRRTEFNIK